MILYLTKITILLSIALVVYKLLLEDTKAHKFKRFYLLFSLILALVIPLITLPVQSNISVINTKLHELTEVIISPNQTKQEHNNIQLSTVLLGIYILGGTIAFITMIVSLLKFKKLRQTGKVVYNDSFKYILHSKLSNPFTFNKCIYLPETTDLSKDNKIIIHEQIHVKQKHTYDILFIEVLKILFWFHPLFYIYKNSIALNHEFLADQGSINSKDEANEYLQLLLNQTYNQSELNLSNSFNFNLTKKRFIMITKKNNPYRNAFAIFTATALFLTAGVATVQAQEVKKQSSTSQSYDNEVFVAVEKRAEYPGGMNAFNNDFISKFVTPKGITDSTIMTIVQFIVEADGSIYDASVVRDPGHGIGQQVIQILKTMPKWSPAELKGRKVRSQFTIPIKIQVKIDQEN
ncbi:MULTISPECIES: M56 family metallopeptidase [unclassified Myroides]|uniref:M56 family metallopeptidase n=1 Tax=unclassified Myroides TaxID=2642485 RepID=UPI0031016644